MMSDEEADRTAVENEQLWLDVKAQEAAVPAAPQMNPEQAAAVEQINTWIDSGGEHGRFFCLRGYAGTGKTFCISRLLATNDDLDAKTVVFTAPTNKAVKVLKQYLAEAKMPCATKTIYSLLGLQMTANGELKELTTPDPEAVDLSEIELVIVDEGSMVNSMLMREIELAARRFDFLVLFMGDPAQLPPVGETTSPIWKIDQQVTLTKVMRYGNSILDLATSIRNVVDHPAPSVRIMEVAPVFVHRKGDFEVAILESIEALKAGEAKVIAWRNVTVNQYNTLIRRAIYGIAEASANPFLEGDKIVATEPGKDLEDNPIFKTDEEFVVQRVSVSKHPKYPEYEVYRILAKHEDGRLVTLFSLTEIGKFDLDNKLNDLSAQAKAGNRRLWREFWSLKEAFHQIRPSYAITSHRSQGSTYSKVFVDRMDILLNRNRGEAFRSLYVAVTRAKSEVHIC